MPQACTDCYAYIDAYTCHQLASFCMGAKGCPTPVTALALESWIQALPYAHMHNTCCLNIRCSSTPYTASPSAVPVPAAVAQCWQLVRCLPHPAAALPARSESEKRKEQTGRQTWAVSNTSSLTHNVLMHVIALQLALFVLYERSCIDSTPESFLPVPSTGRTPVLPGRQYPAAPRLPRVHR